MALILNDLIASFLATVPVRGLRGFFAVPQEKWKRSRKGRCGKAGDGTVHLQPMRPHPWAEGP